MKQYAVGSNDLFVKGHDRDCRRGRKFPNGELKPRYMRDRVDWPSFIGYGPIVGTVTKSRTEAGDIVNIRDSQRGPFERVDRQQGRRWMHEQRAALRDTVGRLSDE